MITAGVKELKNKFEQLFDSRKKAEKRSS